MSDLFCHKHKRQLECLGGRNAHRSNWYCPECDAEKQETKMITRTIGDVEEQSANGIGNPLHHISILCGEIRFLQSQIKELSERKATGIPVVPCESTSSTLLGDEK